MRKGSVQLILGLALFFISCQGDVKTDNVAHKERVDTVESTNSQISQPISTKVALSKVAFDSLHLWELGKTVMTPIYETLQANDFKDQVLFEKLNVDQRGFYYFWQLDNSVSSDGFLSIFPIRNSSHIEEVLNALERWGASETKDLIEGVQADFKLHEKEFIALTISKNQQAFAKKYKWYDRFTKKYIKQQDGLMLKIEQYIRAHPNQFITLN